MGRQSGAAVRTYAGRCAALLTGEQARREYALGRAACGSWITPLPRIFVVARRHIRPSSARTSGGEDSLAATRNGRWTLTLATISADLRRVVGYH
jgi:hypothetical protein